MIKYLKKLWNKYFKSLGYSRIKEPIRDLAGTGSDLGLDELVLKPEHCVKHNRFKKSCSVCQRVIK